MIDDAEMDRRHMAWPLNAKVIFTRDGGGEIGTVFKHDRECHDYCCVRVYGSIETLFVKFSDLFLIDTDRYGERPWYMDMRDEADKQAQEKNAGALAQRT